MQIRLLSASILSGDVLDSIPSRVANKGTESTIGGSADLNGSVNAQKDIQVSNVFEECLLSERIHRRQGISLASPCLWTSEQTGALQNWLERWPWRRYQAVVLEQ